MRFLWVLFLALAFSVALLQPVSAEDSKPNQKQQAAAADTVHPRYEAGREPPRRGLHTTARRDPLRELMPSRTRPRRNVCGAADTLPITRLPGSLRSYDRM